MAVYTSYYCYVQSYQCAASKDGLIEDLNCIESLLVNCPQARTVLLCLPSIIYKSIIQVRCLFRCSLISSSVPVGGKGLNLCHSMAMHIRIANPTKFHDRPSSGSFQYVRSRMAARWQQDGLNSFSRLIARWHREVFRHNNKDLDKRIRGRYELKRTTGRLVVMKTSVEPF